MDEIDSDSSSEDDGTRINPLNQNLQVLAERTLLEMFQSNNATGPSSSDIQPPNTEPSSLNIQPLNGGPSSAFLVHDARPSSLINILPEDSGPLTPSIIRNDAGSSNLQAFKPTHASILTPIGWFSFSLLSKIKKFVFFFRCNKQSVCGQHATYTLYYLK